MALVDNAKLSLENFRNGLIVESRASIHYAPKKFTNYTFDSKRENGRIRLQIKNPRRPVVLDTTSTPMLKE